MSLPKWIAAIKEFWVPEIEPATSSEKAISLLVEALIIAVEALEKADRESKTCDGGSCDHSHLPWKDTLDRIEALGK